MKIIRTHETDPESLTGFERDQVYNGLDVCVTHDVYREQAKQLDEVTAKTYAFSKALQGPTLEMSCRGVRIDLVRREEVIDEYFAVVEQIEAQLERIVLEGVGMAGFNWRSPKDVRTLLYDILGLPTIRNRGAPTANRDAREQLEVYTVGRQICKHLNVLQDLGKKISTLKTDIDDDGRIRTRYNIAGTVTGRFSSSESEFGTGGNLQNIEESLRSIFIADEGFKFVKCDAKSGESFCVGAIEWNLFGDGTYLDACESGDPHTAVARICWPNLGWTGDLATDKKIAEQPFYRHHSYRFMCKKLGHGSNYGGTPPTLAAQTKLDENIVAKFQPTYFNAFPAHRRWHEHIENTLRTKGFLVSLMGRRRYFFGRRSDPDILREAIAYNPQSSLAEIVNTAMLQIWRAGYTILMMNEHDALTFMYRERDEAEVIPRLLADLPIEVPLANGRTLRIPYDCKIGWNKGEYHEQRNPDGLRDWTGAPDKRKRTPPVGLLDRIIRRADKKS